MDGTVDLSAPLIVTRHHDAFERLEAQITELWGHLNAATYKLLVLIAKFDRERAYERHNLASTAQWLNWQCGIGGVAAREKVRAARALENLPEISAAFASGEISYSKVRAMTRVATRANESVLVNIARYGTASHVEKLVRRYRWTQRRDAVKQAASQQVSRQLHYFYDEDDDFVLSARLPPEVGAVVLKALEAAGDILREESRAQTDSRLDVSAGTSEMTYQEYSHGAKRADALRLVSCTRAALVSGPRTTARSCSRGRMARGFPNADRGPPSPESILGHTTTNVSAEASPLLRRWATRGSLRLKKRCGTSFGP